MLGPRKWPIPTSFVANENIAYALERARPTQRRDQAQAPQGEERDRSRLGAKTDRQARGSRALRVEDMEHASGHHCHASDAMACARESVITGCRLHRTPQGAEDLDGPREGIRYMYSAEAPGQTSS